MSVKTNTYLSKVIAGLAKEGGGHNIESAFFEQPDNSIDADASEIIIAYSESKYVFINADNGTGTTDILSLWGCGNIVSKSQSEIGKKMIGELAASLYYQPTNLRYKSVCNSDIPNQYAHIDLANIMSIVSKPDKLQKEANEEIEQYIDVQAKRNKVLHQDDIAKLCELANGDEALVRMIMNNNKDTTGLMKFMEFSKTNAKFKLLISNIPKLIAFMNLFTYNNHLRNGLQIKLLNLDNPMKNQIINKETANAVHILGRNAIVLHENINLLGPEVIANLHKSPDFGYVDLNRVHIFNISQISPGKWLIEYVNLSINYIYDFTSGKMKKEECSDDSYDINCLARLYIANIGETEREFQKNLLGISSNEEMRKPWIMLNTGKSVRGLCQTNYPALWAVTPRNLKEVSVVLCLSGESEIANVSGNKSSFNADNIHPECLEILKDSALRILKGLYDYKKCQTQNEDNTIMSMERRDELMQIINGKKKLSSSKKPQLMKRDVEQLLQELTAENLEKNKEVLWKMIESNCSKIDDVNILKYLLLEQLLPNIEGENTIIAGASGLTF
jgi:hypothetical protein